MTYTPDFSNIRAGNQIKVIIDGKSRWLKVTNYIKSGGELKYVFCGKREFTPAEIKGLKRKIE